MVIIHQYMLVISMYAHIAKAQAGVPLQQLAWAGSYNRRATPAPHPGKVYSGLFLGFLSYI